MQPEAGMMHYTLRLFENEKEVSTSTVAYVRGASNYPSVGQIVDDTWRVLEVISHTADERWLRVERIKQP